MNLGWLQLFCLVWGYLFILWYLYIVMYWVAGRVESVEIVCRVIVNNLIHLYRPRSLFIFAPLFSRAQKDQCQLIPASRILFMILSF